MPSYCCKDSCYVVAYLHEVVLISCIRLLLANYLLIVAKIFKSLGQTTARHGRGKSRRASPVGAHLYLLIMSACTRGHFQSCDTDGSHMTHIIRSAIAKNACYMQISWLCFTEPESLPMKVLHCGNRDFFSFLLLWPWPWSDDLHIWTLPIFPEEILDVPADMNFLCQGFWKLLYVRQRNRHDENYMPCHFTGGQ